MKEELRAEAVRAKVSRSVSGLLMIIAGGAEGKGRAHSALWVWDLSALQLMLDHPHSDCMCDWRGRSKYTQHICMGSHAASASDSIGTVASKAGHGDILFYIRTCVYSFYNALLANASMCIVFVRSMPLIIYQSDRVIGCIVLQRVINWPEWKRHLLLDLILTVISCILPASSVIKLQAVYNDECIYQGQ